MKNIFRKWRKSSPDAPDTASEEDERPRREGSALGRSQQPSQPRARHTKQPFRVQGMPTHWNLGPTTLMMALQVHFGIRDILTIHVNSIAAESHHRSCTATITFDNVPNQLEALKNGSAWVAPPEAIPSYSRRPTLTIDKDFWGITTLAAPTDSLVE